MCNKLNSYDEALYQFGTRCEVIIALERGKKIDFEAAYQEIKKELRTLKKARKAEVARDESSI
jgi:hypothetical protein